ncbi:DUF445 domain-containing protein [Bacillus sp. EB600]|uniref:DUF445 domain-containing protein n=1 Tax=Bacillus sp. EB600 TaxID=2806345 RepID=UPI0021088E94|nr:DUF445 domain-containing protein [Bacillus sp. EB600]MCQ6280702.1 DUF445 domain-containing protein [Bacillus sp. EB600]
MLKRSNNSQYLATISLAIMAFGFVGTMPIQDSLWGIILQGGFEAGLVGGLADWFAVTALFRHPLGIPIPHTALLPKNRTKITKKITSMLENDWLTKESIKEKISTVQFTQVLLPLIEKEVHSEAVKNTSIRLIQRAIQSINLNQLVPLIEQELKKQLQALDLKSVLSKAVDQISERRYDEKALDYLLDEIDQWANQDSTKNRLGKMAVDAIENIKADGIMQFALKSFSSLVNEEKLGNIIQSLIQKGVSSFREPSNQNRLTLLWNIQTKLQSLKTDEKFIGELNGWITELVNEWQPENKILEFLTNLKQKALDFVLLPGFYDNYILPFLINSLSHLKNDSDKLNQIENWLQMQSYKLVEKNHSKIGTLVEENLDKLDDKTLIEMLETSIGKDLQWIRVNGAICGFFIGLVLVGIRTLF